MLNASCILAAIFLFSQVGPLAAQNNYNQALSEGASISQPIRIYNNTDLSFGIIIPGETAGIIHVTGGIGPVTLSDPPTAPTTTSCVFPGGSGPIQYNGISNGGAMKAQVASLIVTGEPNTSFSISVSGGTYVGAGNRTISVRLDPPCGIGINAQGNTGTLSAEGVSCFTLGGALSMGAHQASGIYTGSFSVLVLYN